MKRTPRFQLVQKEVCESVCESVCMRVCVCVGVCVRERETKIGRYCIGYLQPQWHPKMVFAIKRLSLFFFPPEK